MAAVHHIAMAGGRGAAAAPAAADTFPLALLQAGLVSPADLAPPLFSGRQRGALAGRLLARGALDEGPLLDAAARHFGAPQVDPCAPLPPGGLIDAIGATECLRLGLVPWQRAGAVTVVATSRPEDFAALRPMLERALGPVSMALAPAARVEAAVLAVRGARLARAAEARVPDAESCRHMGSAAMQLWWLFAAAGALALVVAVPLFLGRLALAVALVSLFAATVLKIAASLAALRPALPEPPPPEVARLPQVSILVALYRESDIAPRLVRRLSRLDYPRDLLEVILAVEDDDRMTRDALAAADLPPWMRIIILPAGRVRTKPRALNLALDHCRGSIVGVYDAEDAPDPDQIRRVVDRFHRRGPQLACLQGVLDYYNPFTNWLSRCFTIEYATWFRLMLPGVARLGLAVPLGGTTLFFRRAVLEELGGWDAHNVTEDADLGIRLARHGYRTELIDTVTREEANCRPLAWIKQRSRWIKGYMVTWGVHMRDPVLLWRQIGARRFIGFQIMFLGSILQALLAPLLWSFWIVAFGLPHPLAGAMSLTVFALMNAAFALSLSTDLVAATIGLRRSGHRLSPLWVLTMQLYFPLATFAAFKALWELAARPFYWDKTHHGLFDKAAPPG